MPEKTFLIELVGSEHDLAVWKYSFPEPFSPMVRDYETPEATTLLSHDRLAVCDDLNEAYEVSKWLVPQLNGVLRVAGKATNVISGAAYEKQGDRFLSHTVIGLGTASFALTGHPASISLGGSDDFAEETVCQTLATNAPEAVQSALEYLGEAEGWYDLYKAYEVLGKKPALVKLGFETDELDNFNWTAQIYRHDKPWGIPDNFDPLNLNEGEEFIKAAIRRTFEMSLKNT